jgi:hypothetical protein
VLDNYFDFVQDQDQDEWKDTQVVFDISETDQGTEVHFTHIGLVPQLECFDVCSNAWSGYLDGSLRDLILTGLGRPNPKEGDAASHQEAALEHRSKRSPLATSVGRSESRS